VLYAFMLTAFWLAKQGDGSSALQRKSKAGKTVPAALLAAANPTRR